MNPETMIGEAAIEENLKQFLLVLSVSLSVATLPRVFSWFRQIPYTLLLGDCRVGTSVCGCPIG
jgi:CPA1 family monovalent cation:H+ antiporter